MGKRSAPGLLRFDFNYPLIPLTEKEKLPIEEGGGASLERFLRRIPAVDCMEYFKNDYYKLVELLYFKGGKLSPAGLRPRKGIDEKTAYEVLCGMLMSPFPNHIQKEATVALAIYNWYEEGLRETEDEEPLFPSFFRKPGTNPHANQILVGNNRN